MQQPGRGVTIARVHQLQISKPVSNIHVNTCYLITWLNKHIYSAVCKHTPFYWTFPTGVRLLGPFPWHHTPSLSIQTSTFRSSLLGKATQVHRKHGQHSSPPNNLSLKPPWISSSCPTASQKANPPDLELVVHPPHSLWSCFEGANSQTNLHGFSFQAWIFFQCS